MGRLKERALVIAEYTHHELYSNASMAWLELHDVIEAAKDEFRENAFQQIKKDLAWLLQDGPGNLDPLEDIQSIEDLDDMLEIAQLEPFETLIEESIYQEWEV